MWHYFLIALSVAVGVSVAIAFWRQIAQSFVVVLLFGSVAAALLGLVGLFGFGFWWIVAGNANDDASLTMAQWGAGISFVVAMIGAGIFNGMQAIARQAH